MLFERSNKLSKPLSELCRPENINELFGQEHIWSQDSALFKLVNNRSFHALLFWGPPGTGKTSLANVISKTTGYMTVNLSAVSTGVKEIRESITKSENSIKMGQDPYILFVDEIHRLNKGQQDVLLPAVESGAIKFIGATTENPSFEVNNAILSRCLTFRFKQITKESIISLLQRGLKKFNELNKTNIDIAESALDLICQYSSGDARYSLNVLESGLRLIQTDNPEEHTELKAEHIEALGIDLKIAHDKKGDSHYDLASALIKSLRASHPDASVYYLARLIEGGEDPNFIARRLLIFASEDIGNANPTALTLATSAMQAVHMLGMPEARITLSQLTTYLACSPKSNKSYEAINKAIRLVKKTGSLNIPKHLKNAPTDFMKSEGNSIGYIYPHDDQNYRSLTYFPDELPKTTLYSPGKVGVEAKFTNVLSNIRPVKD